jgi:hypothetical protein
MPDVISKSLDEASRVTGHKHRSGMHGLAMVVAVSALMSGCAPMGSGGVVEIGPNTYMLGRLGGVFDHSSSRVKAQLYAEGAKFCSEKNMVMTPYASSGKDAKTGQYASAEIQFRCIEK